MANCGCNGEQKTHPKFKTRFIEDQAQAAPEAPAQEKPQEGFKIAGFSLWTVLLMLGVIYAVFNMDQ